VSFSPAKTTKDLITRYYAAFNAGDISTMLECLSDDVAHHVNEGRIRHGKPAFAEFSAYMARCYRETLEDIVVMVNDNGTRAAAEFTVHGVYLATDQGLPKAQGQTYCLPAGGFFSVADGQTTCQITRIVTYYNLADWVRQVSP
jgi:steroid delta-isomerase-like uncharacterized protein